jgi:VCBS repeat-containing protein
MTYLFVAGFADDGVSVFSVGDDASLSNMHNVADDATLELDGARSVATAVVGGMTYLFVAGFADDGVSVFSVGDDGSLANVHNVADNATLRLRGADGIATAVIAGTTYLFVTGFSDNGVSVFAVGDDGLLASVHNVADDGTLELFGASSVTVAGLGGADYLFVTGRLDDGVSVFEIATDDTLTGTDAPDVLNGAAGDDLLIGLAGDDTLDGGSGPDALTGGDGNDTLTGGTGNDRLYGDVGDDTALFSGSFADYLVTDLGNRVLEVQDLRGGSPDGTDTLHSVENIAFADGSVDVAALFNAAPVAQDGAASGDEDTVIVGQAAATDVDTAPAQLAYGLVGINGGAQHGSVILNPDGSFSYTPDADFNGTDSFTFRANDGFADSNVATIAITVDPVDDAAGGATTGGSIVYVENDAPTALDPALTVEDPDSTELIGAQVAIVAGFAAGEDVLGFIDQNDITGSYDAATGVLTLSGVASLADYQQTLRSVTYVNSSDDPSDAARTVTFQVDDSGGLASLGDVGVTVLPVNDAPAITSNGSGANAAITVDENTTAVTTVVATDADDAPVYSLVGGGDQARFQIDAATGALRFITAPNFEAPGDADGDNSYVVQVRASDGSLSDDQTLTVEVANVLDAITPHDFNGDFRSDILWRDGAGTVALWEMNGVDILSSQAIATISTSWQIVDADGDFNADGGADVLWRDQDGTVVLWEMDGANVIGNTGIADLPDHWHIADTGDLTGDGRHDILWRDDAGVVVLWEMNGPQVVANVPVASVPTTWQIADTGDFNGDRHDDILWRHDDGTVRLWEMDGATVLADTAIATLPDYWNIAGTGDFNRDGTSDILWRDDAGTVVLWEMNGAQIVGNTAIATLPDYWHIPDTGDYTGDGASDILWRDDAGTVVLWEMNGPTIIANTLVNTIPNDWQIVA